MAGSKQNQAAPLVFLYGFNQLYPGRKDFKGIRFCGTGVKYLPSDECKLLKGKLIPRNKYRGKKQVIREMVKRMEEHAQGGTDYSGKCFMSCSACEEDARKVADLIEEKFPKLDGKVRINSIGTVIGSHTAGRGAVLLGKRKNPLNQKEIPKNTCTLSESVINF